MHSADGDIFSWINEAFDLLTALKEKQGDHYSQSASSSEGREGLFEPSQRWRSWMWQHNCLLSPAWFPWTHVNDSSIWISFSFSQSFVSPPSEHVDINYSVAGMYWLRLKLNPSNVIKLSKHQSLHSELYIRTFNTHITTFASKYQNYTC